jgi:DNA-binding MarR family transcriptional regulator
MSLLIEMWLATPWVISLIARLGRRGLVRGAGDRSDRRRVFVSLTPRVQQTIAPLFASLNRHMLTRIDEFLVGAAREMRNEAIKHRQG